MPVADWPASRKVLALLLLLFAFGAGAQLYYNWVDAASVTFSTPIPTVDELKATHGAVRSLTHKDTRRLYRHLINTTLKSWVAASKAAGADARELAVGCTRLRWRVRLYTRTRDLEGGWLTDHFLAARDAYVHALTKRSVTALLDLPACLAGSESLSCPSYASLYARKRSHEKVLAACLRTSAYWDLLANTLGEDGTPLPVEEVIPEDERQALESDL